MIMFTHQNMVRVAPNFSPCEKDELILSRNGISRMEGTSEIEVDLEEGLGGVMGGGRNEQPHTHPPGIPRPRMEIPVFEGPNPRWWLRKSEKLFNWYNIPRA